jgi:iron complex transport system permease protein
VVALLIAAPLVTVYVSLFVGRFAVAPEQVMQILLTRIFGLGGVATDASTAVVIDVRLPRVLIALLAGAGLSISGASFQGMFRNPLVSPDILGVSAAAGFGAALAILLSANTVLIQVSAFAFGILGVALTYSISRVYRTTPVVMLVLGGVVVAAFFGALVSAAKYVADPENKLPAITFWLLGSLSTASWQNVFTSGPVIVIGVVGLLLVRWRINLLAMGDEEARALGVRVERVKAVVIVSSTLATAAAVAVTGIIGWVGLIIPHVARMLVGPDHRGLLPASLALGGTYLLIVDDIARGATSVEVPLGILTALLGAPFFAYLLRQTRGGWS